MAAIFSWFSSALQSAASSWLGSTPKPDFDCSYFASPTFELDPKTAFMPRELPLTRLDGQYERWEVLLDAAFETLTCPGDEAHIPDSQLAYSSSWRRAVREVSRASPTPSKLIQSETYSETPSLSFLCCLTSRSNLTSGGHSGHIMYSRLSPSFTSSQCLHARTRPTARPSSSRRRLQSLLSAFRGNWTSRPS